jgi:predicted acylesterase/phospholipase RssA
VSEERVPRRALILAGGGLKVAFQAGVLQVWLDEAEDLDFHLADAASGGVFNLAMWCQGMSGTEIADAWRRTNPLSWLWFTARPWRGISSLDRFRRNVIPRWGLDWDRIRASGRDATFNVYNFSKQRLETITPARMNADWLVAGVSLPTWFAPRVIGGDVYIDSVYATDANLEHAVERGANELWIIWTVSRLGTWRNGWINQYFQTIEASALGELGRSLERIEAINAERAPADRVEVKILQAEVPMHYLFVFSSDTLHGAVEHGVETARRWCRDNGIALREPWRALAADGTALRFTETMTGFVDVGAEEAEAGAEAGRERGARLGVRFTIHIDGLRRFLVDPKHAARVTGTVTGGVLGGTYPVDDATFNQFVFERDPALRRMVYRARFRDGSGRRLTLEGEKHIPRSSSGFHPWRDTTTLFTRLVEEHDDGSRSVAAAGVLRISPLGFLRQLLTFRAGGGRGVTLLLRYFAFFVGVTARVYLRGRPVPRAGAPASERSRTNRK